MGKKYIKINGRMFGWKGNALRIGTNWEDPNGAAYPLSLADLFGIGIGLEQIINSGIDKLAMAPAYSVNKNNWAYTIDTLEHAGAFKLAFTDSLYLGIMRTFTGVIVYAVSLFDPAYTEYTFDDITEKVLNTTVNNIYHICSVADKDVYGEVTAIKHTDKGVLIRNAISILPVDTYKSLLEKANGVLSRYMPDKDKVYYMATYYNVLTPLWFDTHQARMHAKIAEKVADTPKPGEIRTAKPQYSIDLLMSILHGADKIQREENLKKTRYHNAEELIPKITEEVDSMSKLDPEVLKENYTEATVELVDDYKKSKQLEDVKQKALALIPEIIDGIDNLSEATKLETAKQKALDLIPDIVDTMDDLK